MLLEEQIGNTPLVDLQRVAADIDCRVSVKLEGNNPAGSVKDRPAIYMIRGAEERGDIHPGDTLIEATSGNTGIALAMAAAIRGYRMCLVMPESMSLERRAAMAAFGAELVLIPKPGGMEQAIDRARALQAAGEGRILDQFANPDNPRAHYEGTGPEIWHDTNGGITHFVSSMGTTGTVVGTGRYLKEQDPAVAVIGVQPLGDECIPGIRRWPPEYLPGIYDDTNIDEIMQVTRADAIATTLRLSREEGIFAGISSGGCVHVALQVARANPGGHVVAIVCDRGDRYLSTGVYAPVACT